MNANINPRFFIGLIVLLVVLSLGIAFGQDGPRHSTKADTVLRNNPGAALPASVRETWRTILGVVSTSTYEAHVASTGTSVHGIGNEAIIWNATQTFAATVTGSSSTCLWKHITGELTFSADQERPLAPLTTYSTGEVFIVDGSNGKPAKYYFYDGTTTAEDQDPETAYTPTKDNAGTLNIYITGGVLYLQNKTVGAVTMRWSVGWLEL
jgi:hypothetical protein